MGDFYKELFEETNREGGRSEMAENALECLG